MTLILSGTDGVSDIDGTAGTPAIRGSDANTGIFFGADIIGFSEGGTECARFNADAQFVAAAGTAALPVITTTGDVNTGMFFPAADTIAFAEGGAEAMRIDSSGRVGIGVTPSVSGTKLTTVGGPVQLSPGTTSQEGIRLTRATGICQINGINNDNNAYNALTFATGASEAMRIDTSGNVGIGTSSPNQKLTVRGGRSVFQANSDLFSLQIEGASAAGQYYIGATNEASPSLVFSNVFGTEQMRIGSAGTITFNAYGAGTLSTSASGVISASDGRYKTKTREVTSGLEAIAALQPTYFRWNEDSPFASEYEELGFVAQEVAAVIPEASPGEDEEGKYRNYHDRAIIAMLVKGMQELKAELDTVKAELATLKG